MKLEITENRELFLSFKSAYPSRDGSNPWKPAEMKFNNLVKSGVDPKRIIDGARRFALDERRNVGTRFIPMAVTWLNQQRFIDLAPIVEAKPEADIWDAVLTSYKKFGIWSRHAGPDPESPACRCPRDKLAQFGIVK